MRRMWMLLLVLVLTVVIMAVPAMAAGEHDSENTHATCNYAGELCDACRDCDHESDASWKKLSEAADTISADGKYYVDQPTVTKSITVSGGNVVICLNGNTWAGEGTTRTLYVSGGATVTIVDCGELLEGNRYVTKGVMKGVQLFTGLTGDTSKTLATDDLRGGTISVDHGTVYFYNGTITGGTAVNGGNVALDGSSGKMAYFYFNGGQIKGAGKSNYTSYASSTKTSTVSSLEDGGIANNRGGNVYVYDYAEFHMGNTLTEKVGDGYAVPSISGGNTLFKQGGNISVSHKRGYFYLKSGILEDSFSTDVGGNVHLGGGQMEMTGGKITDGKTHKPDSAVADDIYHNTGTFTMSGGEIDGAYQAYNYRSTSDDASLVKLSGTAKIVGAGLYLSYSVNDTSTQYVGVPVIRVGKFLPGANIVVSMKEDYLTNDNTWPKDSLLIRSDDKSGNSSDRDVTGDGQITWADYDDVTRFIHAKDVTINKDNVAYKAVISYEADGIFLRMIKDDEIHHCVCSGDQPDHYNAAGKIVHFEGCDGYDHTWTPYPMVSDTTYLPGASLSGSPKAGSGYYYLVEGDDNKDGIVSHNQSQANFCIAGDWFIDMNGLTIESDKIRAVVLFDNLDTDVTITNSKGTGGFRGTGTNTSHSYFWVRRPSAAASDSNAPCKGKELNVYRVSIDASNYALSQKLISVETGIAGFYGVTINGATCTAGAGAAFNVANDGKLTLDGCTVNGGTATTTGGCINFDSTGKLIIRNSAISGGTAPNGGNTIYINKGQTEIADSTIAGGVYYKNGTLTLSGNVKIRNLGKGLESGICLADGKKLTIGELGNDSDIIICPNGGVAGTVLTNVVEGLTADHFGLAASNLYLTAEDGVLKLADELAEGTKVVRNGSMLTAWPTNMFNGDFVKLYAEFDEKNIPASITLDLNGNALTGLTVAEGKKINLFDSTGSSYEVPEGSVTLAAGQSNPFAREFLTGSVIDRNLRFVTIKENDGKYTAHRIYLAVKSTVLYPKTTVVNKEGNKEDRAAVGFRIALRCDDVLAEYVNAYGVMASGDQATVPGPSKTLPTGKGASNDNSRVIGISYPLNTDDGEKTLTGSAYITFGDGFGSDAPITSGAASTTLKAQVESAFEKYGSLNNTLKANLDWMVSEEAYGGENGIMSNWDIIPPVSATLNNKKILFIGNSYTFWGNCVIKQPDANLSQVERTGDQGYFYQLCKANGAEVEVTNWTFGGHCISDSLGICSVDGAKCVGANHLEQLENRKFDYVVIQLFYENKFDGSVSLVDYLNDYMDMFRAANSNVKFLFLVPRDAYTGRLTDNDNSPKYRWVSGIEALKDQGVLICNWGDMIYDIEQGRVEVPDGLMEYTTTTFINTADRHHQNLLVGYLTALMTYSAITRESAVGQPYDFCGDTTINAKFDMEEHVEKYYPTGTTNFIEVMESAADMEWLQEMVDYYLKNPINNY